MGLLDNFLKNLDDSLDDFEKNVQKLDDKLNAAADNTEKAAAAADTTVKKVETVSKKAIDVLQPDEKNKRE